MSELVFVKNMVCDRCVLVVKKVFDDLNLKYVGVKLGEVSLESPLKDKDRVRLVKELYPLGFELIDDKKARLIEQIKTIIIHLVHHQENEAKSNLSEILSSELNHDYNYLSNLFSEVEGTTIEKYYISQRIEKVKELLVYDELTLSEIAFRLNYSSVAYLSNQFKKVTGLTPSHFKQIKEDKRKPLDKV